ncbi:hypothetical protein NLY09_09125 (plasmid) [Burkholderia vietnamiensis]
MDIEQIIKNWPVEVNASGRKVCPEWHCTITHNKDGKTNQFSFYFGIYSIDEVICATRFVEQLVATNDGSFHFSLLHRVAGYREFWATQRRFIVDEEILIKGCVAGLSLEGGWLPTEYHNEIYLPKAVSDALMFNKNFWLERAKRRRASYEDEDTPEFLLYSDVRGIPENMKEYGFFKELLSIEPYSFYSIYQEMVDPSEKDALINHLFDVLSTASESIRSYDFHNYLPRENRLTVAYERTKIYQSYTKCFGATLRKKLGETSIEEYVERMSLKKKLSKNLPKHKSKSKRQKI